MEGRARAAVTAPSRGAGAWRTLWPRARAGGAVWWWAGSGSRLVGRVHGSRHHKGHRRLGRGQGARFGGRRDTRATRLVCGRARGRVTHSRRPSRACRPGARDSGIRNPGAKITSHDARGLIDICPKIRSQSSPQFIRQWRIARGAWQNLAQVSAERSLPNHAAERLQTPVTLHGAHEARRESKLLLRIYFLGDEHLLGERVDSEECGKLGQCLGRARLDVVKDHEMHPVSREVCKVCFDVLAVQTVVQDLRTTRSFRRRSRGPRGWAIGGHAAA